MSRPTSQRRSRASDNLLSAAAHTEPSSSSYDEFAPDLDDQTGTEPSSQTLPVPTAANAPVHLLTPLPVGTAVSHRVISNGNLVPVLPTFNTTVVVNILKLDSSTFSGKVEELEPYLLSKRQFTSAPSELLALIILGLRDHAKEWWLYHPFNYAGTHAGLEAFLTAIRAAYNQADAQRVAHRKLTQLCFEVKPGSWTKFRTRFLQFSNFLGLPDRYAITVLADKVPSRLLTFWSPARYVSLTEALNSLEEVVNSEVTASPGASSSPSTPERRQSTHLKHCTLHGKGKHSSAECNALKRSSQTSARDTSPLKPTIRFPTESSSTPSSTPPASVRFTAPASPTKASVRCFSCGTLGHLASQCPSRNSFNLLDVELEDGELNILELQTTPEGCNSLSTNRDESHPSLDLTFSTPEDRVTFETPVSEPSTPTHSSMAVLQTSSVESDKHPYTCLISIANIELSALIDTGASASFISPDIASKLSIKAQPQPGKTIRLGNDQLIPAPPILSDLEVNFAQSRTKHSFLVLNSAHDAILGRDILPKLGYSLSWSPVNLPCPPAQAVSDFEGDTLLQPHPQQKQIVAAVLDAMPQLSATQSRGFCTHPDALFSIEFTDPNTKPVWRRQYPIPQAYHQNVRDQLTKWLKEGVIRRARPGVRWSCPITLAPKRLPTDKFFKTGKRVCIDPSHINPLIKDVIYALPTIPDLLRRYARGGGIYSLIDIDGAFTSILMDPEAQDICTFEWEGVRYSFVSCPFGVKTIPAFFQRLMSIIFIDLEFVTIYIDDLFIHSRSVEDHIQHLIRVFDRLKEFGLWTSAGKCHIGFT
ncbi:MAG: reverse transcriptase family protein, partial [Candidatus Paceibacterota bacterium]